MTAMSDYWENKLIDFSLRGQAYSAPVTVYIGLHTATPNDAGGGTEVTGGSYARVAVTCSLANFAGTQSAGSTTASSGTGGTTSNNGVITFPTPSAGWGNVVGCAVYDAPSGGNLLFPGTLTVAKTINIGDAVSFPAGSLTFQIDN